jgi:GntR family transcriptional regulator, transcriptional repressor for pyruvate dehydrogenase complex
MNQVLTPLVRQSLSDGLAERVRELIQVGNFKPGDRLPSINDMARRFGVGHPTLREALKKLETLGVVTIRHGSGVYVGKDDNSLVISNPIYSGAITRKLLIDLIEARIPVELTSVELAARNATENHLLEMEALLKRAEENLDDDEILSAVNMAFHRAIASASGNRVLAQLLDLLTNLFHEEQRVILGIYGSRQKDHREHLKILDALKQKDAPLAVGRMRDHLEEVRDVLLRSKSDALPEE